MISPQNEKRVAIIVGPTASGKSALALELAKRQAPEGSGVVINADSAQVYRDLQILSARPTAEEMERIEHRLYGYIDGAETCSAGRWASDAKREIGKAHQAGKLPILVGGTGLYVRTLLNGIAPIPDIDTDIRSEVRSLDSLDAYHALSKEDPVASKRLEPRDKSRVMRALEVVRSTGHPLDYWHRHMEGGIAGDINLRALVLLPPRDWLYERCDRRFTLMMEQGARAEVEAVLARKLTPDCPVTRAIGVAEIKRLANGEISESEAERLAQAATRQYAKRQYTWFRNQLPDDWHRINEIINKDNINNIVTKLQY